MRTRPRVGGDPQIAPRADEGIGPYGIGGRQIAAPAMEGLYMVRFEGRAEPLRLRWRPGRGFRFPRSGGEVVGNVTGWEATV